VPYNCCNNHFQVDLSWLDVPQKHFCTLLNSRLAKSLKDARHRSLAEEISTGWIQ